MITLNLPPEIEEQLRSRAALVGISVNTLIEELARTAALNESLPARLAPPPAPEMDLPAEEWLARLDAITAAAPPSPVLSDEDTRRSSIYED